MKYFVYSWLTKRHAYYKFDATDNEWRLKTLKNPNNRIFFAW